MIGEVLWSVAWRLVAVQVLLVVIVLPVALMAALALMGYRKRREQRNATLAIWNRVISTPYRPWDSVKFKRSVRTNTCAICGKPSPCIHFANDRVRERFLARFKLDDESRTP